MFSIELPTVALVLMSPPTPAKLAANNVLPLILTSENFAKIVPARETYVYSERRQGVAGIQSYNRNRCTDVAIN